MGRQNNRGVFTIIRLAVTMIVGLIVTFFTMWAWPAEEEKNAKSKKSR
jgi:hypothetical protein